MRFLASLLALVAISVCAPAQIYTGLEIRDADTLVEVDYTNFDLIDCNWTFLAAYDVDLAGCDCPHIQFEVFWTHSDTYDTEVLVPNSSGVYTVPEDIFGWVTVKITVTCTCDEYVPHGAHSTEWTRMIDCQ